MSVQHWPVSVAAALLAITAQYAHADSVAAGPVMAKFTARIVQGACTVSPSKSLFELANLIPGNMPDSNGLFAADRQELTLTINCDAGGVTGGSMSPSLTISGTPVTASSGNLPVFRTASTNPDEQQAGPPQLGIVLVDKNDAVQGSCNSRDSQTKTLGVGTCALGAAGDLYPTGTPLKFDLTYGERGMQAVSEGAVTATIQFSFDYK